MFIESTRLAVVGLLAATPVLAQVYKWTDAEGRTHYGDVAPEEAKASELRVRVPSFDGPPRVDDWAAIIRRPTTVGSLKQIPAPTSAGLTMYSTPWCGYCRLARGYLAEKGIAYREVNIEASDASRKEFGTFGGGGVPLFISGTKRMRGFSAKAMQRFLASASK